MCVHNYSNQNNEVFLVVELLRGGRNVENQNIEGSECRKYLLGLSERRKIRTSKIRTSKIRLSKIRMSKRTSKVKNDFRRSDLS